MTLANIVDRRLFPYRWKSVRAVAEATAHHNSIDGADQACLDDDSLGYAEIDDLGLGEAIAWADALPGLTTLYIYDAPEVIVPVSD